MEIIFILLGLFAGALFCFLFMRSRNRELLSKIEMLQWQSSSERDNFASQLNALKQQIEEAKNETKERVAQAKNEADEYYRIILSEKERNYNEAYQVQQRHFREMIDRVAAQLKSSTDEMLRQRQKEFAEYSNVNLGRIVTPLRETIDKMKVAMNDSALRHTAMSSEMKAHIETLMRQSEAARLSAEELARVLKHKSKVQGDWGERVLDELLESQGLTRGIHYDVQTVLRDASGNTVKTDEGSIMRPDVILHLDHNREIIIDSKVSLTAFFDYVNASDDEQRSRYLKEHIDSLQRHIKSLSGKSYASYIRPPKIKMDYVIMFVPHVGALWAALNAQPDMWRKAMAQNVFIADEQTLFAALRMISLTWTHIAQAENHEKVYALANEILERVGIFLKRYDAIGKALDNAVIAYEEGKKKLIPGGQSIVNSCTKLQSLGAKQSDKHPIPQIE